jgi:hypothetical protein
LVAFYTFDEGKEWLALTPGGYFAATKRGADVLRYQAGSKLLPMAKFRRRFERPDLLRHALIGQGIAAGD